MSEPVSTVAAVRGAIQVAENRADLIQAATARLLTALLERNALAPAQIVSAIFTATPDLDADFPAHAARRLGWSDVPLLGAVEIAVPGALPRVVRVLLTVSGVRVGSRLAPVYLEGAAALRPDLTAAKPDVEPPARAARAIAIIGLGQIGGSIGLALASDHSWRRVGFDLEPEVAAAALAAGAIDEAATSIDEACRNAEIAVIAIPVDRIPGAVLATARALPRGAALVDTGSARAGIAEALRHARERGIDAVGGHPIAGNAGRGFGSAEPGLFRGSRFALCPLPGAEAPAIVLELVAALGAEPLVLSPEAHDAALARTSHLPYLLARAVRDAGAPHAARGLSGPSFRDLTRVAASDPRVAEAYCRANLAEVRAAWDAVRAEVGRALDGLERGPASGGLDSPPTRA